MSCQQYQYGVAGPETLPEWRNVAKLRVHELAKELGITSKELMGHLKEAGEFDKSSSS